MKLNLIRYLKKILLVGSIVLTFTKPIYAQDGQVVAAINQLRASVEAIFVTAAYYIFQVTPNLPTTIETNYTRNHDTGVPVAQQVTSLNKDDITRALAPDPDNLAVNLITLATIPSVDLASATLNPAPAGVTPAKQKGTDDFNYQSLITPHGYDTSQNEDKDALNYIRFISDYATPISNFNLERYLNTKSVTLAQKRQLIQSIQTSSDFQTYLVARRALAARQTAALTVLYQIYARRLPIPNIKAADTALNKDNPSALQLEDYIANWRSSTPNWYQQMETAPPTTIARETLYVLVEVQRQLQSIRMDNERLIALQAIGQLQALGVSKTSFKAQQESNIRTYVDNQVNALLQQGKAQQQTTQTATQQSQAQQLQQQQQQSQQQTQAAQQAQQALQPQQVQTNQ